MNETIEHRTTQATLHPAQYATMLSEKCGPTTENVVGEAEPMSWATYWLTLRSAKQAAADG